jgi:hypothetical protein
MTFAIISLTLAVVVGFLVWIANDDWAEGAWVGGLLVAAVLVVWGIVAYPVSSYQADVCQQKAEGYGLEGSDWSFRHNCRVYLPTGQLVPEGRIRITTDGQIVVVDDD